MNKPEMSREALVRLARLSGITTEVFLVGIRGHFRDSMGVPGKNDRGIYDDACFFVDGEKVYSWNFNTDPSIFRPGIARLCEGVHLYKKGIHGLSKPKARQYWAFRPATSDESLPVQRDGQEGISRGVAINIHRGSFNSTSSEGCQTVYPSQFLNMRETVYSSMDRHGLKTIPYILTKKADL